VHKPGGIAEDHDKPSATDRKGSETVTSLQPGAAPRPEEIRQINTSPTKKTSGPSGRRRTVRLGALPSVPDALALPVTPAAPAELSATVEPVAVAAAAVSEASRKSGATRRSATSRVTVGPTASRTATRSTSEGPARASVSGAAAGAAAAEVDIPAPRTDTGGAHRLTRPQLFPTSRDAWLVLAERVVGDWAATLRAALLLVLAVAAGIMVVAIVFGPGPALGAAILALLVFLGGRHRGGSVHR